MLNKTFKRLALLILGPGIVYISILIHPNLLFANHYEYRNYQIHSDRPIHAKIVPVIDDAIARIQDSELYDASYKFKLYLCNDHWRFTFLTRNANAGGLVNFLISPNIFIRESDLVKNQLIPPDSWVYPLSDRPLSYFIAHESIHSLQRNYDGFLILNTPVEIIEGYAEYIAKGKSNSLKNLIDDYKDNSATMDPQNGLYDRYNLYIGLLVEEKGYTFSKIVEEKPNLDETLRELID